MSVVASPLSYVFFVTGKKKIHLVWHIALLVKTLTVFLAPASLTQVLCDYAMSFRRSKWSIFLSHRFAKNDLSLPDLRIAQGRSCNKKTLFMSAALPLLCLQRPMQIDRRKSSLSLIRS
jgi:hypothetical protein